MCLSVRVGLAKTDLITLLPFRQDLFSAFSLSLNGTNTHLAGKATVLDASSLLSTPPLSFPGNPM